jgi:hypothetical protein
MAVTSLRDILQNVMNPFRKPIDDRWKHLSDEDRRKIASYLKDNRKLIEKYFGPINRKNKDDVYNILKYIETYSIYEQLLFQQQQQPQQNYINKYTVDRYITALKNLEGIIENIKKGYLFSFPQYPNVAKPNNNYIEIVFGISGNQKQQKRTLIEILEKAIGGIMVSGYPAFYYDPSRYNADLPLIYYVQLNNNSFFQRFFIHRMRFPSKATGYLLDKLSRIIQSKEKSLILPSGNQYYIINDYLGRNFAAIDLDPTNPNTDPYIRQYIQESTRFLYGYQEFPRK